jgi:hypothetical protein
MITWAKKHFLELYQPVSLLNAALKKGQLGLAKYICSHEEIDSSYWSSYDPASEATKSGNPEVVREGEKRQEEGERRGQRVATEE